MDPNYTKRRATPPLPLELWLCIFHHATHIPGTLVPDIYDHAGILGPIFIKKFHPALRKALTTKRTLVRVCRQWWHLAVPILYRSVYIGNAHSVSSLCSTLERSAEGKGTVVGTRPLGEYTQRLDVAIPDCAEGAGAEYDLLRMLKCMSRLSIFLITDTANYANPSLPYSILNGLRWSANSLRVFDWSSPDLELSVSQIKRLLDDCAELRVLNCPGVLWSVETEHVAIPPTVTTLRLCTLIRVRSAPAPDSNLYLDRKAVSPPVPLPALRELVLDFSEEVYSWDYLFDTYGAQLLSVHLYKPSEFEVELNPSLRMLARTCPNLRRLTVTITSNNLTSFADCMSELSSVSAHLTNTYLGLRVCCSSRPDFKALFRFLGYLRLSMPSLQVVQLLNGPYVRCLLMNHTRFAVRALRRFTEADSRVRLEDEDGVLLTDRLKAFGHM